MYKVACFKTCSTFSCFSFKVSKFLRFPEGFFATFIVICSYFISGFSAGNKKICMIYFYLILLLCVILNIITMYIDFTLDVELS